MARTDGCSYCLWPANDLEPIRLSNLPHGKTVGTYAEASVGSINHWIHCTQRPNRNNPLANYFFLTASLRRHRRTRADDLATRWMSVTMVKSALKNTWMIAAEWWKKLTMWYAAVGLMLTRGSLWKYNDYECYCWGYGWSNDIKLYTPITYSSFPIALTFRYYRVMS